MIHYEKGSERSMDYSALVLAAGSGQRMQLGYNKVFYELENGKTVLDQALSVFKEDDRCKQIVLVCSANDIIRISSQYVSGKVVVVLGGETRQESVYNGLKAVHEENVLIHDGARPWVSKENIDSLLETLQEHPACLLMVPAKDTIKVVEDGVITKTLEREKLWMAQTPQAFDTRLIISCYKRAADLKLNATDDAQVVELTCDMPIKCVLGSYDNIKITTKEDIGSH